ncbi:MAG: hypothetical protein WA156_02785 [Methylocystis silviterrae]
MKRKDFTRFIDTIFAAKSGEEMLCTEYFDKLRYDVDLQLSGQNAETLLPEVNHHMHQCPECEEVYLALLKIVGKENPADPSK